MGWRLKERPSKMGLEVRGKILFSSNLDQKAFQMKCFQGNKPIIPLFHDSIIPIKH
jgi:hypothetical protein